jgi:hypothetical protein
MNKILVFGLLSILGIGLIVAGGYVYNNYFIRSDVYEPFSVEYAIVGDGSTWDQTTTCQTYAGAWTTYTNGQEVDVQGLYAGESRLACARITNAGEAPVDYTFSYTTSSSNESEIDLCKSAFGENSISGEAVASGQTLAGIPIYVSDSALPVNDCLIHVEAIRG